MRLDHVLRYQDIAHASRIFTFFRCGIIPKLDCSSFHVHLHSIEQFETASIERTVRHSCTSRAYTIELGFWAPHDGNGLPPPPDSEAAIYDASHPETDRLLDFSLQMEDFVYQARRLKYRWEAEMLRLFLLCMLKIDHGAEIFAR